VNKTILITGCSSGIGEHCALALKAKGWRVFATARKAKDIARLKRQGLETFYLDYTEPKSIQKLVKDVSKACDGKLYALFNNGAYGQPGAMEDITRELLTKQFEANVFGWHDLTRRIMPLMRANGAGRIIHNSSVLGLVAMKWRGAYNASKFAIEAIADTMRLELRGSAIPIHVVLIEPGPIQSKFVATALAAFDRNIDTVNTPYAAEYRRRQEVLAKGGAARFKLGPEAVLVKLERALLAKRPAARYAVTTPTHLMGALRRILPQPMLDWALNKASDQ
jgi:NAD(P)-dependent dehydrogenase (short-subunit alcohol dehydrogenase family)